MDNENGFGNEASVDKTKRLAPEASTIDFDKPDALVGRTLDGRFVIEKNLTSIGADEGGFGIVYLATDTKLMGKAVVVKILQESALKHPDILRKFQHEKEALIRLDHPGIVRILDTGMLSNGNPFMVMSYIKGQSLRRTLRENGQLSLKVVAHVIECVTDALSAAHSEKILHRDIKPENIMLTPQDDGLDQVRLIDFGIARVEESKLAPATEFSRAIGTVLYIAPEQLIGKLDLTPAADIYAVAIVAYEMLTGELPFKPKAIAEMYQLEKDGVQTLPGDLRPDLPRGAERILLSALEFDPEKRPQNARAFGSFLANELLIDEAKDLFLASIKTEYAKFPTKAMPTPDPDDFATVQRVKAVSTAKRPIKWAILAVIVLAILTIPVAYLAWLAINPGVSGDGPIANKVAPDLPKERHLTYFLMVQKMRNGKVFEEPFKSSGQEVYESGYRFTMNFQPDADGYIYIFNEGKDQQGNVGYYLIFPTLNVNDNSSKVSAGQLIGTAQNGFGGERGTEIMWLVWSEQRRDDLESVWQSVPDKRKPVSNPDHVEMLRSFQGTYNASKPESTKDTANQRTVVKAAGDLAVHRFELEHR